MQSIPRNTFGSQLGQALSTGIQELAQHKLEEITKKYEQKQLKQTLKSAGLPDNVVNLLSGLDDKTRGSLLKNLDLNALGDQNQYQQTEQQNPLEALMQQVQSQNQQSYPYQKSDPYQQLLQSARHFSSPIGQLQAQQGGSFSQLQPQQQQPVQQQFNEQVPAQNQGQLQGQGAMPQPRPLFKSANTNEGVLAREKFEFAKEEAAKKHEQELQPFLEEQHKQYQLARRVSNKAGKALNILEKKKNQLPWRATGLLPSVVADLLITDPEWRTYSTLLNEIVKDTANVDKGPLTKPKIQLTEAAKANFSQPYKTQRDVLLRLKQAGKDAGDQEKYIASLQDKKTGRHPENIKSKVIEYQQAQDEPLEYPQYYKPGTIVEEDGKQYENVGGNSWKKIKGK